MITIAIDNGFSAIKAVSSEGGQVVFPSRVKRGRGMGIGLSNNTSIEIGSEVFTITDTGSYSVSLDKFGTEKDLVCTLAAIGLLTERAEEIVNLVVGLPIGYFNSYSNEYKTTLLGYGTKVFKINGKLKRITIRDVLVLPQSACNVYMDAARFRERTSLIIDIGGLTIDYSLFNSLQLQKWGSYTEGMITFYARLREIINSKYPTKIKQEQMDYFFQKGFFMLDGQKIHLAEFDEYINDYVQQIVTYIDTDFPIKTVEQVILMGGAAMILFSYFKNHINHIELYANNHHRNQMANADAFLDLARRRGFGGI